MAKASQAVGEKEKEETPEAKPASAQPAPKQKLLIYGGAVFVLQLVVIYFVVAKFIMPASPHQESEKVNEATEKEKTETVEQHIFVIKDLIINPAGTNGTRFLLTTIGFEVSTAEAAKELETREIQLRDILNTILTSKGLDDLANAQQREELRTEIAAKARELVRNTELKNVYFSKFIIQ
jgi:flagellar FliL protein